MVTSAELGGLFHGLEEAGVHRQDIRDVICAAAGLKVSRVAAGTEQAKRIRSLLESSGVSVVFSDCKFISAQDYAKAAWSNRCKEIPADSFSGHWQLYISRDPDLAEKARL